MSLSDHLRAVRAKVGHDLLLLPAVGGLVYDDAGRVLLQRHSETRRWVMPGGAVEPDETPTDTVVRELWEETGLWVEPLAILGIFGGPEFVIRVSCARRRAAAGRGRVARAAIRRTGGLR
jgi:8-oxo-dGTP pyrophosphatase MutT (NUDIX family)